MLVHSVAGNSGECNCFDTAASVMLSFDMSLSCDSVQGFELAKHSFERRKAARI